MLQPFIDALIPFMPGYLELPESYAGLLKSASHRYIKRVPKAGGGYRYFYHVGHGSGVAHEDHFVPGASFRFDGGHYHIKSEEGGKLVIEHDETKERKTVSKAELRSMLTSHHEPAIKAHREKVAGMLAEARANKASPKQIAKLEARAAGSAEGTAGSIAAVGRDTASIAKHQSAIAAIERATGFTVTNAEVAMDADGQISHMKLEAKSPGRWVVAAADSLGRSVIETYSPSQRTRKNVNRFDGAPPGWEFLGRTKLQGARTAARAFAHYLADNATYSDAGRLESRQAVARLLGSFEPRSRSDSRPESDSEAKG